VSFPNRRVHALFRSAALLLAATLLWPLIQLALSIPSPVILGQAATLLQEASVPLPAPAYQALHSMGYVLIPLVGFMCALVYVRGDRRYLRFVHIVLGVNLAVTIFCLGQYVTSPRSLLWAPKNYYLGSFTGTFINPNTAATHFAFLLVIALSLSLFQLERVNLYRLLLLKGTTGAAERAGSRRLAAYSAAVFVFLVALMLTKSRAGIISALVGVACFASGFAYFSLRRRWGAVRALGFALLSIAGVVAATAVFGERVLLRVQGLGLVDPGRLCTYSSTWSAIWDAPWWGTGLGTFQDVFPAYRTPSCGLYGYWETAHSVFLEAWLGLGVAFIFLAVIVYYQLARAYGRGVWARHRFRFVPLACLALLATLTLHSLVDFSLQVPGFALAAAGILGAGAAVALADGGSGYR
jgi:O-antigen ligase